MGITSQTPIWGPTVPLVTATRMCKVSGLRHVQGPGRTSYEGHASSTLGFVTRPQTLRDSGQLSTTQLRVGSCLQPLKTTNVGPGPTGVGGCWGPTSSEKPSPPSSAVGRWPGLSAGIGNPLQRWPTSHAKTQTDGKCQPGTGRTVETEVLGDCCPLRAPSSCPHTCPSVSCCTKPLGRSPGLARAHPPEAPSPAHVGGHSASSKRIQRLDA